MAQGIEDQFIEQWHQKLHTNTTPEDITICEAYLAFLHSWNDGEFWRVLWDNGRITRDMLATMDHPITGGALPCVSSSVAPPPGCVTCAHVRVHVPACACGAFMQFWLWRLSVGKGEEGDKL